MDIQPENQFDFWLGEWEACWNENERGTNHVTRILDGKIIQEDFNGAPASELHGLSFSAYDPERKLWCQTWVDNSGGYLDFTGLFQDGQMVLSRNAIVRGEKCKQRMVWYNIEPDRFDWNWERSDDEGLTWRVLWQIKYTRKK
jgi:hypothetical protein